MAREEISTEEAVRKIAKRDRYLGVLWERIDDKLSAVIEGNDMLDRKIDRVDVDLQEFRIEVNEKFEAYSEDVKSLRENKADKKDMAAIERRVTALEA